MLGRPIPLSSIDLIRVASVKRGGGWVKCCDASNCWQLSRLPAANSGRELRLSSASPSSRLSRYRVRKPGNLSTEPVARKLKTRPVWSGASAGGLQAASMFTVVASERASAIWLASIRAQISW